jgi:lactoylglutathione lyase
MNLEQAVPLFLVSDMERSLRFYVDGLGFEMKNKWTPEGDRIRWCWLQAGGAAVMLQESQKPLEGKPGLGVSIWFQSGDSIAIYHQLISQGIAASKPFVGNGLWDTSVVDPDGYKLHFESPTDVAEGTEWAG